jgi:iron complex transport system substrate-binding protein
MNERRWRIVTAVWALAVASLTAAASPHAASVTDATGRQVHLASPPQRIVALTPSAVETLFAIGAGPAVVGRGASATLFPPEAEGVPVVDSLEAILKLRPQLIVSHPNHHRFTPPMLEQLGAPVLLLEHRSVQEVLANIALLGAATGHIRPAAALRAALQERLNALAPSPVAIRPRVLLLFGTPRSFLIMGEETYAGDLLRLAGGHNVVAELALDKARGGFYPLSLELIVKHRPEWVLVISHGDPTRVAEVYRRELEGHPAWWQIPAVTQGRVHVLPDDLFATAPGPRLDQSVAALRRILTAEAAHAH